MKTLLIKPNAKDVQYQSLEGLSAVELPLWLTILANYYKAEKIIDAEAERLSFIETVEQVIQYQPDKVVILATGSHPSAYIQQKSIMDKLASVLKDLNFEVEALDHLPVNPMEYESPRWDLLDMSKYRAHNWQCFGGLQRNNYGVVYTTISCPYHCFVENTIIGIVGKDKKIQDVKIGDKLLAFDDGKIVETKVKGVMCHNVKELYKITFEDGNSLTCTPEHPFYVKSSWIEARHLKENMEITSINGREKGLFVTKRFYEHHVGPTRPPITYKEKQDLSDRMKKNNPVKLLKVREKISKTLKEQSPILSKRLKELWKTGKMKHVPMSDEVKEKLSKRMKVDNPMKDKKVVEKMVKTTKEKIKSGEIIPFMCTPQYWKALKKKKNKMEIKLEKILNTNFPNEWKFVGDGSIRFDYYSPDFINTNGQKKLIEFQGCYWHGCKQCFPNTKKTDKRDKARKKVFKAHEYKTLEIWQHEFKNENEIIKKVGEFLYNGFKITKIEAIIPTNNKVYNFECIPYNNYFVRTRGNSSTKTNYKNNYVLSHNCEFCTIHNFYRSSYKQRDVNTVLKDFHDLYSKYGITNFKIMDELFVTKAKRTYEILDGLKDIGDKINIWTYARIDTVDEQLLKKLRAAGIKWVSYGIETGNDEIRRSIMKGKFTKDDIKSIVQMTKDCGVSIIANYMFGFWDDNYNTMRETLDFAKDLNCEFANFYATVAYPGSKFFDVMKERGVELSDNYNDYAQFSKSFKPLPTKHLTSEQVLEFRDKAFQDFFTSPKYLSMMKQKFGNGVIDEIKQMTNISVKRIDK